MSYTVSGHCADGRCYDCSGHLGCDCYCHHEPPTSGAADTADALRPGTRDGDDRAAVADHRPARPTSVTADHRHRQGAARLLLAIPKSDDRVTLVAEALAAAETAALAPVLALADELDLRADAKSSHPMGGYNEGYNEGLSDGEHYAAERVRQAAGGDRG